MLLLKKIKTIKVYITSMLSLCLTVKHFVIMIYCPI